MVHLLELFEQWLDKPAGGFKALQQKVPIPACDLRQKVWIPGLFTEIG